MKSVLAQRYARGLCKSIDSSQLKSTYESLVPMVELFENSSIRKVLTNPSVDKKTKLLVVEEASKQLNHTDSVKKFLKVLVLESRLNLFPEIMVALDKMSQKSEQSEKAVLSSATSISEQDQEDIKKKMEQKLGIKIEMQSKVDPNLLGGFVLTVGQKQIDLSVRRSVETILTSVASSDS